MNTPATKADLKVEVVNLENRLINRMDSKFATKQDLFDVESRLVNKMDSKFPTKAEMKKEIRTTVKKSENRIIKKLNIIIGFFDKGQLSLDKQVTRIENHLNLSSIS